MTNRLYDDAGWVGRLAGSIRSLIGSRHETVFRPSPGYDGPPALALGLAAVPNGATSPASAEAPLSPLKARERVRRAFDAGIPVFDRYGLTGRNRELSDLTEAVIGQRKHALVFGPRGSGKTSLAYVFGDLADEARCLVIYQSASEDSDFATLLKPYLAELAKNGGASMPPALPGDDFDARDVANWFSDNITRRTILVIDEFDRIENPQTKVHVASLMKLLSDMRSNAQLIVVGIARNVGDLLEGHPSLRRHIATIPVGPIASEALATLLDQCCQRAGIEIAPGPREKLVRTALGSPHHLRLFGLNATIAAERREAGAITDEIVDESFGDSLRAWMQVSEETGEIFALLAGERGPGSDALLAAASLAAYLASFSEEAIAGELVAEGTEPAAAIKIAEQLMAALEPVLVKSGEDDSSMFTDSLAPQYLALLALGYGAGSGSATAEPRQQVRSLRAAMRGNAA